MTHSTPWRSIIGGVLMGALPLAGAWAEDHDDEDELEFDEAFIFFELNNTDGDLGIHAKIDGDPWKKLVIEDPRERRLLKVRTSSRLRRQGLTELFFESAEPTFDELPPAVFFRRFPPGTYEIEGWSLDGEELESETELTHLIPAPPAAVINGQTAPEDCSLVVDDDVVISWPPVTHSHPTLGLTNQPIEVVNYEVVVEIDDEPWNSSTILPPDVTSFEVPEEILELSDEIKFEVLVREASWNQTAMESCFTVEEDD